MARVRDYFNRRLTAKQGILVVLLIGLAGGSAYLLYNLTVARILSARIHAAVPVLCDAIRHQREAILNALEAYKTQFGAYPPDHLINLTPPRVDPLTNTLLYELAGTLYHPGGKQFQVGGLEPADESYVTNFFQCRRFRNCSENPQDLKHFLPKQAIAWRQLHDDPDVFVLGFDTSSASIPPDLFWQVDGKISSWRYVQSSPTNNPGKFDLWIELNLDNRVITIGNWKAVE